MKRNCKKNFVMKIHIANAIKDMNIEEVYKELIVEVLLRRAKQYKLSQKQVDRDIERLKTNFKGFSIVNGQIYGDEDALAVYDKKTKEIIISSKAFEEDPELLFQILSHELYHVLLKDKEGHDSYDKYNNLLCIYGQAFKELVVEKASYKTVFQTQNSYKGFNPNSYGYQTISFALDMIEATYGVNEQKFLEHAIMGREELTRFLAVRGKEEYIDTKDFLEQFEVGMELLMRVEHPKKKTDMSDKEKQESIQSALETMYNCCMEKLGERMSSCVVTSMQDAVNLKNKIGCCADRLKNILMDRINFFESDRGYDIEEVVIRNTTSLSNDMLNRLSDIEQITESMRHNESRTMIWLIEAAQYGTLSDEEFENKMFEKKRKKPTYTYPKELPESMSESKKYCSKWNNGNIGQLVDRIKKMWQVQDASSIKRISGSVQTMPEKMCEETLCTMSEEQKRDIEIRLKNRRLARPSDTTQSTSTRLNGSCQINRGE